MDGVHPNLVGHSYMAQAVLGAIDTLFGRLQREPHLVAEVVATQPRRLVPVWPLALGRELESQLETCWFGDAWRPLGAPPINGWHFNTSDPQKMGWVATSHGAHLRLAFPVSAGTRQVHLQRLVSRESGAVEVACTGTCECNPIAISGFDTTGSGFRVFEGAMVQLLRDVAAAGECLLDLTVKSGSPYFKLAGVFTSVDGDSVHGRRLR